MEVKEKKELKKFIKELEGIRGRHTELVSVYIPAGYELIKIIQHLQEEQGTANNIKDKTTRTHVIDSLERMIRHLRLFKKTPENGLAAFAGNVSEREGQSNIQVWSIEPPKPMKTRTYRCDQTFQLDLLKDMMEHDEVFGLIVVDKREGNIGFLKGNSIVESANFHSNVPGKTTKGGQCLAKNSIVQINDGCLEKIENLHNPYVVKSVEFEKGTLIDSPIIDKWDTKKQVLKIITKYPRIEIESSPDHVFFVRDNEIIEKSASELKEGDCLLMPEKIEVKGKKQKLNFKHIKFLNKEFAQFLGYFIGDGSFDGNRLSFAEGNKEVAFSYKKLFDKLFKLETKVKFRENKNYYQLRIYSKELHDFVKKEFLEIRKSLDTEIPRKILLSENEVVASFLKGLYDAEGYVSPEELSIGMNNKYLIQQLQMILLRFGIISSFCVYDNKRNMYSNNFRYTLRITDRQSLLNFKENIGFSFSEKNKKLEKLFNKRTSRSNLRQIITRGTKIREIFERDGFKKQDFSKVSNFFFNQREMSKEVFRDSILRVVEENKELYNKLKLFLDYNLIPVKIKKIEVSDGLIPVSDISVKNQNFIANCVLVHNSQARYARIRELAAKDFFNKIASAANKEFLEVKTKLKGILVGGPGHTKNEFVDGSYLNQELKDKVIAVQDLSYTGEFGLQELVEKSKDNLADELITEEKEIMNKFLDILSKDTGKAAYGEKEVLEALKMGAVETLLISEEVEDKKSEEFEKKAEDTGATVRIISTETREGVQLKDLGGIAAILRFAIV